MKVIITGGTGLVGTPLSRQLVEDGDDVVILSRSPDKPSGLPDEVRIVQWDARSGEGWSDELRDADVLINLAGSNLSGGRWTESRKQLIRESRVNAGNAVLDGMRQSGHVPPTLVQASGINYYGHRTDTFVDESEPPGDDFLARVCVEWENTTAEAEQMGARRVIIRSGPVLNTYEGALPPIAMPFHMFAGGRTGSGDQGLSWIHLADEVAGIRFLIRNTEIAGPVNLCAPRPVSNKEFADAIGRVMRRPSFLPVPAPVMRFALGEVADTILLGQFGVPERLRQAGFRFQYPNVEEALQDLLAGESRWPGSPLFRRGASIALRLLLP